MIAQDDKFLQFENKEDAESYMKKHGMYQILGTQNWIAYDITVPEEFYCAMSSTTSWVIFKFTKEEPYGILVNSI